MTQQERTTETRKRQEIARRTAETTVIALGMAALFILLWYIGDAFLVIFAGVLFGALIDAAIRGLGQVVALDRRLNFALVLALFAVALAGFFATWGVLAVQQIAAFLATLDQELERWRSTIAESEFGRLLGEEGGGLMPFLPDPAGMLTRATSAITGIFGLMGSAILIVMLGVFFAYDPLRYRSGILQLLPSGSRSRVSDVMDEAGSVLRWWLVGIAINMLVIGAFTTVGLLLIGVPHAAVLGVQAGLFAFVPTLGPVVAAIPILLVSLTQSYATVFWALALYALVQTLESNILTPLVQMEMVLLSPATILMVQLFMFALFGALGLALATPLTAVGKVFVQRLYVEDWLGDRDVRGERRRPGPGGQAPPLLVRRPARRPSRPPATQPGRSRSGPRRRHRARGGRRRGSRAE
jgi:predicted PurR-regulated permease PerM